MELTLAAHETTLCSGREQGDLLITVAVTTIMLPPVEPVNRVPAENDHAQYKSKKCWHNTKRK